MNNDDKNVNTDATLSSEVAAKKGEEVEMVDDIDFESYNDEDLNGGEMALKDKLAKLREALKQSQKQSQEYLDGWQRLKADFVNYKKREEEGKEGFVKFAKENLVGDLLPVLESFQMAFANKEAWERVDVAWRSGVEYIHTQLLQVLEGEGLQAVSPLGEKFDPNLHTAIENVQTDDMKKNHMIAEVVQAGYTLGGKMIRSPKVKVYSVVEASETSHDKKE